MRRHRLAPLGAVLSLVLTAGCGGSDDATGASTPTPTASSSPSQMNMRLLSQMDLMTLTGAPGGSGAGNWGYTSPDGRRFALTGTSFGTSIVEVTDPARPRRVTLIPGITSAWREIRTYGPYVYVTTEGPSGMDIISMEDPDRPVKIQTWSKTFIRAHSLWIDTDRGLLFANGTNGATGGMRVLDVGSNPEDPDEIAAFTDYYVHDSYSRGDVLFAAAINDGFLAALDVSDPRRGIREITRFFTGGRFTHNVWVSRDGRYLFTTDERTGRPVEGWDVSDLQSPRKVSEFIANPSAIAHNVLIDGDRLLLAHYTEGVYLLDIRNPERPAVMGFYDTFSGPSTGFAGSWAAYVFPGSNLIIASDMSGGLFVIEYTGP